jgi:hypothetical protein
MDFLNTKKNYFLTFWILQHVCKTPKGVGQYSKKKTKILFFGEFIYYSPLMFGWRNPKRMNIQNIIGNNLLLFAINVWIKKLQVVNIQNIFLGIISHHISLKEASIIIEDISIFFWLHCLQAMRVWNTNAKKSF